MTSRPAFHPATARPRLIDRPLWFGVLGLMFLGAAFIFSATGANEIARNARWFDFTAVRQILAYIVGTLIAASLCVIDYARLTRWALIAYWGSILLLVCVYLFGVERLGAKRWIDLGPVQFQPSEFAKLAFLFALANFLSRPLGELASPALFAKALGMALLPFVLILKQPDLGSALVFMPTAVVMMLVAGVPMRFIGRFLGGSAILVVVKVVFRVVRVRIAIELPGKARRLEHRRDSRGRHCANTHTQGHCLAWDPGCVAINRPTTYCQR